VVYLEDASIRSERGSPQENSLTISPLIGGQGSRFISEHHWDIITNWKRESIGATPDFLSFLTDVDFTLTQGTYQ
jgi:hypothetical protein